MPDLTLLILVSLAALILAGLFDLSRGMHRSYRKALRAARAACPQGEAPILTEERIAHLPRAVNNYIRFSGAVGMPEVRSFRVVAGGKMKMKRNAGWADIRVEQYNCVGEELRRVFFIDMRILFLHMYGLHVYSRATARMTGKAAGLFKIMDTTGREMRISDTITVLNDMCLFAPASLIDSRIAWEELDALTVKATFTTEHCTVTAVLRFAEDGRLLDFVSDDRYYIEGKNPPRLVRWSTPIAAYRALGVYRLMAEGGAAWQFPDGEYRYIEFTDIRSVSYNDSLAYL